VDGHAGGRGGKRTAVGAARAEGGGGRGEGLCREAGRSGEAPAGVGAGQPHERSQVEGARGPAGSGVFGSPRRGRARTSTNDAASMSGPSTAGSVIWPASSMTATSKARPASRALLHDRHGTPTTRTCAGTGGLGGGRAARAPSNGGQAGWEGLKGCGESWPRCVRVCSAQDTRRTHETATRPPCAGRRTESMVALRPAVLRSG
jgi:hypothetical protein